MGTGGGMGERTDSECKSVGPKRWVFNGVDICTCSDADGKNLKGEGGCIDRPVQVSGHSGSREWGEGTQDSGRRTQEKREPLPSDQGCGHRCGAGR